MISSTSLFSLFVPHFFLLDGGLEEHSATQTLRRVVLVPLRRRLTTRDILFTVYTVSNIHLVVYPLGGFG